MDERAPKLPFWIHQIVEYGIGVLLSFEAVRSPRPVIPLLAGLVVVVLAATADGPAACFHAVGRPIHRVLDYVVAAGFLVAAIVFGSSMTRAGRILLALAALALGVLTLRSDYRSKAVRRVETKATLDAMGSDRAEEIGRSAARLAARGVKEYRRRWPGK